MLISTGKVAPSEPWRILEVSINQAPDVLALRISKELKRLHTPAEAVIPMTPNAAGQPEWIVEHVYVRGLNGSLPQLAATPGIEFTRKELAPAEWIAQLLQIEKVQAPTPQIGDFVRLLVGPCARMCGEVASLAGTKTTIAIRMQTKCVRVHTTLQNVQPVECPPEIKFFYFT